MKKLLVLSLFAALALAMPALGQTALTGTTLSAALDSSSQTLRVASATGIVANSTILFIVDGTSSNAEADFVNAVNGTNISVTRGYNGTKVGAHLTGAVVLLGSPTLFPGSVDPAGSCTASNTTSTPRVTLKTGRQWLCSSVSNSWVPGWFNTSAPAGVTAAVASAAGQVIPSGPLFHITGALAITGFTPALGQGGSATSTIGAPFCVIPDGAYTTTATNNIAVASTGVVNKLQCWTFDQTNKKYVPSY